MTFSSIGLTPLVGAELRFGVRDGTTARAGSCSGLRNAELARLREAVRRAAPEAIAISLLFSFANPENEVTVAAAVAELGKPLSVSHRISAGVPGI